MKTKQLLWSLCMALIALFGQAEMVSAQRNMKAKQMMHSVKPGDVSYYAPSKTSNYYISAAAGVETYFADHLGDQRFTLALNASVGRWVTPIWGFRFSIVGGGLEKHWVDNQLQKMDYMGLYGDVTWDLMNTFCGYNKSRLFTIIPFAGIGYNYAFSDNLGEKTYAFPISAGMKFNFCISRQIDLFLEARANLLGDHFDNIVMGSQVESITSLVGGISFKLGKQGFIGYDAMASQAALSLLNREINQLRVAVEECLEPECPPCPEVVVAEVVESVAPACSKDLTAVVRFGINSSKVSSTEMVNVYNVAQWMKQNPTCGVSVVGYADKGTGTADYNFRLSEKRAQEVVRILTSEYGIDASRLMLRAVGSSEQPYPENNDWNRVVVFFGDAPD